VVEIFNQEDLERWFYKRPREWALVIAVRAALRLVAMLATELGPRDGGAREVGRHLVLPAFRSMALSWFAAAFPEHSADLRDSASVSGRAANLAAFKSDFNSVAYAAFESTEVLINSGISADDMANSVVAAVGIDDLEFWRGLSVDLTELSANVGSMECAIDLAQAPLWYIGAPDRVAENWLKLKRALLALDEDWEVWTDWYEARLRGGPAIEELELARVMIADKIWRQGPKVVNAHIKELIARYTRHSEPALKPRATRAELAEVVSPAPTLSPDKLLDAGSNAIFDAPDASLDLPNLPIRQRALIQTILDGLPSQSPKHLKSTLEKYDGELLVRGVQPMLGLLNDMAAIVEADIGDANARREWLAAGIAVAFGKFLENHDLFAKHFPLNLERDALYARTPVDEDAATGPALAKPFEDVAKATVSAHGAGLTTDDFVKIVASLAEFAKVTSTLPPAKSDQVSAKKRTVLTGIGFLERVYNILGTTVTLAATSEGAQLFAVVTTALEALSHFLH
jgi:hypothetical protein